MKALKSQLATQMQQAGMRIPMRDGARFCFEGIEYVVKYVPKANNDKNKRADRKKLHERGQCHARC